MNAEYNPVDWRVVVAILIIPVCGLVFLFAKLLIRRIGLELAPWRVMVFALILIAAALPYGVLTITAGLENILYFLLLWLVFLFFRFKFGHGIFLSVVCGAALAVPITSFLRIDQYGVVFDVGGGLAATTSRNIIVSAVYFGVLMLAAHWVLKQRSQHIGA